MSDELISRDVLLEPYTIVKEAEIKELGDFESYVENIREKRTEYNSLDFDPEFQKVIDYGKAISNSLRLKILLYIKREGRTCFCELENVFDVKQSTLNYHIRFLKRANFILTHKQGKLIVIEVNNELIRLFPDHLEGLFTKENTS